MTHSRNRRSRHRLADERGSLSLELVLVLPLLLWGLAVTVVAYDGFRARTQAQMAAQTVADLLSRRTDMFTATYLEGMNDVFDFLADSRNPARIRVSSVIWDSTEDRPRLQWSYGTRGLAPLPDEVFAMLQSGDMATLTGLMAGGGVNDDPNDILGASIVAQGGISASMAVQPPVPDLINRIPPILPGEAMILVETFAIWTPFANVGIGQIRFAPVVVTRPRFSLWVNLEGAIPIFPEDDYELASLGYVPGVTDLPDPGQNDADPPGPQPIVDPVTVVHQTFAGGEASGWSQTPTASSAGAGTYLGPFGNATFANPVTRSISLPLGTARAEVAFDLLIIDSWDGFDTTWSDAAIGDVLTLMINGQAIATEPFRQTGPDFYARDRVNTVVIDGTTWTMRMTRTQAGSNFIGGGWGDERWRVTLHAEAPPDRFTLGFSARLNEGIDNESFGIADFSVVAMPGTPQPAAFSPRAAAQIGTHPNTRFPVYGGCPDPRIGAAALNLRLNDLQRVIGAPISNPGTAEGWRGQIGATYAINVTGRASGSGSGTIWGTGIYTDDSTIATAAVHAGVLAHRESGVVWLTIEPGQASYAASTRNGVTSQGWTSWHGSYRLERAGATNTTDSFSMSRQAGGSTNVNNCPDIPGWAHFNASATYVVHWDNMGQSGAGNQLRIRLEDGNAGRTCDTALLVRDPTGQWWFNDDISGSDYNARLNLGNAGNGSYHVFVGTWAGNSCSSSLIFERY